MLAMLTVHNRYQRLQIPLVFFCFFGVFFFPFSFEVGIFGFSVYSSSERAFVLSSFFCNPLSLSWNPVGVVINCKGVETIYNLAIKSQSFHGPVFWACDLHKCSSSDTAFLPWLLFPSPAAVFPVYFPETLIVPQREGNSFSSDKVLSPGE